MSSDDEAAPPRPDKADFGLTSPGRRSTPEDNRLLVAILESATEYGIIAIDRQGVITRWNEGAHRLLGWRAEEMEGRSAAEMFTIEDQRAGAPENELILALSHGRAEDERWHVRKDGSRFWGSGVMLPLRDEDGGHIGFLKVLRDRTQWRLWEETRREAEERQTLLMRELQHRIKNVLALVQGIVSHTLRTAPSAAEGRRAIDERLAALGRAHDILTQKSWVGASIVKLVESTTELLGVDRDRVRISGPDLELAARPALSLTLALHELGTNAVKYGALSDRGIVEISWGVHGEVSSALLTFTWRERGGPAVAPPSRRGFGTRLIETVGADFDGRASLAYDPSGVVWTLEAPLDKILEPTGI